MCPEKLDRLSSVNPSRAKDCNEGLGWRCSAIKNASDLLTKVLSLI